MAQNPYVFLNSSKFSSEQSGFTLIELLVVVAMLGILMIAVLGFLNPYEQFTKSNDSKREENLNQIRVALDSYYNDTGCYPTSLTFGAEFDNPSKSSTIYMKKIPQDPLCTTEPSRCFRYLTDSSASCPQWNVLFGSLRAKAVSAQANTQTLCSLETISKSTQGGCLPQYYSSNGYNFCLTSGQVDCGVIAAATDAAPTLTPVPGCQKIYSCTSMSAQYPKGVCNIVGTDNNGNGLGDYCGAPGCSGNSCCLNSCSQ